MKTLNDKTNVYVLGVSGGPDSMALFDMCRKQGMKLVVAHMNYKKRDTANRDMKLVEDYCRKYAIPFELRLQEKPCVGNFQAFAREERYAFYKHVIESYHAKGVLLAHHLDDHLETYLMQQKRKSQGVYYGIQEETFIMGCRILRPLLAHTKEELLTYCARNQVPYAHDESNFTDDYTRNQIRHSVIEHMSYEEKTTLAKHIRFVNDKKIKEEERCAQFYAAWHRDVADLRELTSDVLEKVLIYIIHKECDMFTSLATIHELCVLIFKKANSWTKDIGKTYDIYLEYGKICIDTKEANTYCYTYDQLTYVETPYFKIASTGSSTNALTLQAEDYPISIRNAQIGDMIQLRFGQKKLNRWFIDRKIPKKERKLWPVVVNAVGNVILVPQIGCDIAHFSNNPNLFVLK